MGERRQAQELARCLDSLTHAVYIEVRAEHVEFNGKLDPWVGAGE